MSSPRVGGSKAHCRPLQHWLWMKLEEEGILKKICCYHDFSQRSTCNSWGLFVSHVPRVPAFQTCPGHMAWTVVSPAAATWRGGKGAALQFVCAMRETLTLIHSLLSHLPASSSISGKLPSGSPKCTLKALRPTLEWVLPRNEWANSRWLWHIIVPCCHAWPWLLHAYLEHKTIWPRPGPSYGMCYTLPLEIFPPFPAHLFLPATQPEFYASKPSVGKKTPQKTVNWLALQQCPWLKLSLVYFLSLNKYIYSIKIYISHVYIFI